MIRWPFVRHGDSPSQEERVFVLCGCYSLLFQVPTVNTVAIRSWIDTVVWIIPIIPLLPNLPSPQRVVSYIMPHQERPRCSSDGPISLLTCGLYPGQRWMNPIWKQRRDDKRSMILAFERPYRTSTFIPSFWKRSPHCSSMTSTSENDKNFRISSTIAANVVQVGASLKKWN